MEVLLKKKSKISHEIKFATENCLVFTQNPKTLLSYRSPLYTMNCEPTAAARLVQAGIGAVSCCSEISC